MKKAAALFLVLALASCASVDYKLIDSTGGVAVTDQVSLKLLKMVPPEYPPDVQLAKIQGIVQVGFTVQESGDVTDILITQPTGSVLDQFAGNAVSQWKFSPYRAINGELLRLSVPITFALNSK